MSRADSKIMRPIRNVEYDHWSYTIDDTYDSRKSSMKSEMIDEIDVISEDNYPKFKSKLKAVVPEVAILCPLSVHISKSCG